MKIVVLCLGDAYNEGFGYQENLLSKYQKILGYLARKGFRYEVIRHVVSDYDKHNCTLPCQSLR